MASRCLHSCHLEQASQPPRTSVCLYSSTVLPTPPQSSLLLHSPPQSPAGLQGPHGLTASLSLKTPATSGLAASTYLYVPLATPPRFSTRLPGSSLILPSPPQSSRASASLWQLLNGQQRASSPQARSGTWTGTGSEKDLRRRAGTSGHRPPLRGTPKPLKRTVFTERGLF